MSERRETAGRGRRTLKWIGRLIIAAIALVLVLALWFVLSFGDPPSPRIVEVSNATDEPISVVAGRSLRPLLLAEVVPGETLGLTIVDDCLDGRLMRVLDEDGNVALIRDFAEEPLCDFPWVIDTLIPREQRTSPEFTEIRTP